MNKVLKKALDVVVAFACVVGGFVATLLIERFFLMAFVF